MSKLRHYQESLEGKSCKEPQRDLLLCPFTYYIWLVADPFVSYCKLHNYNGKQALFPLDLVAIALSYDEPFLLPPERQDLRFTHHIFRVTPLLSFLYQDFQGGWGCELPSCIHWQIRYFRPSSESHDWEGGRSVCLLGDRQRAVIGRVPALKHLEEKRVRVSLRVFDLCHGMFNITILADEDMSPRKEDWNKNRESENEAAWARHGLIPCGKGTPITHYLFEVARICERSIEAWQDALDSIDELVHVNVSNDDAK